jgi:ABC-2 type transport system ATP-binding protein
LIATVLTEETCIIISTHQVKDLDSLIDKIILVDEGEIIVNTDTESITQKLVFKLSPNISTTEQCLYHESSLAGHLIVKERNEDEETTKLDLELFFNAGINNKNGIKKLFN